MSQPSDPTSTRNEPLWEGIEGIVLDAVGTLIEPVPSVAETYAAVAARQQVVLDPALVRARFHHHFRNDEVDEARGPLMTDEARELRRWRRIVGSVLEEVADVDRAFHELWDHFGRPSAWRCFPDVEPFLRTVRSRGFGIRIASNFDSRLRTVVAGLRELSGLEGSLTISSEVGFRKPHPEFFTQVCVSLGLPPEQILCVGDDFENDVLGAVRSNLRGVLLDRHEKILNGRCLRICRLSDLLEKWPV
jgi:putative hydrolase of the HAD superfamily